MAFPVDAGRAPTNSTVSGLTHAVNLPGSIAAGDVLVGVVRCPAGTTITWPAGWEELQQSAADASDDDQSIAIRVADGTEGATITVTLGTARILVGIVWRITGGVGVSLSAIAVGSATQPDSPNFAALTTARDVLWLSLGGCDDSETLTSGPTSYANATLQGSTATGAAGCTVFGASRALNAASENPGAWTLGSTSIWMTWTVAISETAFPSRVTQHPVEAVVVPTSGKARVTQHAVEAVVLPTSGKARVTQMAVEVVIIPPAGPFPQILWFRT